MHIANLKQPDTQAHTTQSNMPELLHPKEDVPGIKATISRTRGGNHTIRQATQLIFFCKQKHDITMHRRRHMRLLQAIARSQGVPTLRIAALRSNHLSYGSNC